MARVFISYSSRDPELAARIKAWIESAGFEAPFIDVEIAPGSKWESVLYAELERCLAVLLIVTPNWLDSKWCFAEYVQARVLGKPIFPIIESPVKETYVAREIQHLDLQRDREGGLDRLRAALEEIRNDAQGGFRFAGDRPPYPGLRPFDADDAAVYFGREEETRRLIEVLRARRSQGGSRLVVVLGASGSGKSSLMRAGVLPRLARDREQWIIVGPVKPGTDPLGELALAFAHAPPPTAAPADRPDEPRLIRGGLEADPARTLSTLSQQLRWRLGRPDAQVLVALDQGEMMFSHGDAKERSALLRLLRAVGESREPMVGLMTFRSDFLGSLQSAPELEGRFTDFKLNPLPPARIPTVIRGPARVVGLRVDDDLVLQAAREAEGEASLPLLAVALHRLYESRGDSNVLTLRDYLALGDEGLGLGPLQNAVRQTADETIRAGALTEVQAAALRHAFIPGLVRVSPEGDYTGRPSPWEEVPDDAKPLLERLVNARLLTITERDEVRTVEVAHDALLRHWPLLRGWIDEERELLIGMDQLDRDLADWRRQPPGRRDEALLTGLRLSRARVWLKERGNVFTPETREFIDSSARAADRARRKREGMRRAILWGSVAFSAVLAVAAGFAAFQWLVAQDERDRALAALLVARSGDALAKNRIFDAAVFARHAWSLDPSAVSRSAVLRSLLVMQPELDQRAELPEEVPATVSRRPDASRFLLAGASGAVLELDRQNLSISRIHRPGSDPSMRILALDASPRSGVSLLSKRGNLELAGAGRADSTAARVRPLADWLRAADLNAEEGVIAFAEDGAARAQVLRCDPAAAVADPDRCGRLDGPEGEITRISIAPTGDKAAFGTEAGVLWIRLLPENSEPINVGGEGSLSALAWDGAGRWLTAGFIDRDAGSGQLVAIDTELAERPEPLVLKNQVTQIAWNPDASALAANCGARLRDICIWDRGSGGFGLRSRLHGHRGVVQVLDWAGERLLSVGLERQVLGWTPNRKAGVLRVMQTGVGGQGFTDVAAAAGGHYLGVGTGDGRVLVFDTSTASLAWTLETNHAQPITAVAWDRAARRIAAADQAGRAFVWEPPRAYPEITVTISGQPIDAVDWDGLGGKIFVPVRDGHVAAIDVRTGAERRSTGRHGGAAIGLASTPDGRELVTADTRGALTRWDARALDVIGSLVPPDEWRTAGVPRDELAFTSDGARMAVVGNDGNVLIHEFASDPTWRRLETPVNQLQDVGFSAEGELVAALAKDNVLHLWRAESGEKYATVALEEIQSMDPEFWPQERDDLRAEKIAWLPVGLELAVTTSSGKVLLIDFDSDAWSRRLNSLLGDSAHPVNPLRRLMRGFGFGGPRPEMRDTAGTDHRGG